MAKTTTTVAGPATERSVHQAMTKTKFERLLAKCSASSEVIRDETSSMGGLISDAVENDRCHKGAFAWARKLDKMDPAKRNEHLFHFHAYCDHRGWPEKELVLGDREVPVSGQDDDPEIARETPVSNHGDDPETGPNQDLRPRFLRTGGIAPNPPNLDDADKPLH